MTPLKIGLVGIGRIGKIHLENLVYHLPNAEVVAVAEPLDEGQNFARNLNVSNISSDYQDLLDHPEVDTIVICSPSDSHAEYVIRASNAGKSIFCEKPLELSLEKVQGILDITNANQTPLMVAFNRRFDKHFQRIRERVVSGDIGDPYMLKITSRDPGPPPLSYIALSGGIFLDQAIHDFDMARFIVGSEVKEVYSKGSIRISPEISQYDDIDIALTTLSFENGAFGVVDNSRKTTYGYDQRLEIFGSKGMALIDNVKPDNHKYYSEAAVSEPFPLYFFLERYMDSYREEMRAFVDAVQNRQPVPVSGEDGLRSMAVGLAAKRSLKENRPVQISEILGS